MSSSAGNRSHLLYRVPWWGWILIGLVALLGILVIAAIGYHQDGLHALQTAEGRLRAAGRGVTPVDLLARIPPLDRARQTTAWAQFGPAKAAWDPPSVPTYGLSARCLTGKSQAQCARETARILGESAPLRAAWRALHREGPVLLSQAGWLAEDLPHPEKATLNELCLVRGPSFYRLKSLAEALATEARTSADPRAALGDLDGLVESSRWNASSMPTLIRIRDDAWLEAASRGVDVRHWLDHPVPALALNRDNLERERMLILGGYIQDIQAGSLAGYHYLDAGLVTGWQQVLLVPARFLFWTLAPHDAAHGLDRYQVDEATVLASGGSGGSPAESWTDRRYLLSRMCLPNVASSLSEAIRLEHTQRKSRLAALLIREWQATGRLPPDIFAFSPEAAAMMTTAWPVPELSYARLDETSLLLSAEGTQRPLPPLLTGSTGTPPIGPEAFVCGPWYLSADLAQIPGLTR